ncbi:dihydrofolate reductase [Bifidobacterium actinocoloniiforme DSM 22766]|uniref:dihydrofolate reductase n=1 Tax=Bifidobacterium actinocoloniiforme DSM 22766 TaxID=1437605 RepID=A0A086Z1Q2_9BIFI|nr:dihydrofolate reductase [Bifidobacterium actinocoloniiforme]AKV55568.1 diacylglycerol kinase [Bifidobacterium actinocoloniiforme DSM 22766]KFI40452.1 dihydrofolate reductase [Bifidobacterium actinocoloniiforme DSM 22766]
MEHDSSSKSGYHEPEPGHAGLLGDKSKEFEEDNLSDPCSINLIWAQARANDGKRGAIGYQGGMPWRLSEDMKRFKELTISHPVLMGRLTWQSMGSKPLPGRDNVVISGNPDFRAPGATVMMSLQDAVEMARQEAIPADGIDRSEIWVIGGARIFQEALSLADRAYVTELDAQVDADTFAPDMDELAGHRFWRVGQRGSWQQAVDPRDRGVKRFRYVTYEKVR